MKDQAADTTGRSAAEQEARLSVAAHLAHVVGCHRCGDTDYECDPGRAVRVAAVVACDRVGPDAAERLYALAETAPVDGCGPKAAAALIYGQMLAAR